MSGTIQFINTDTHATEKAQVSPALPAQIAGYTIIEQISSESGNIYCAAEKNGEKFFLKSHSFPLSSLMSLRLEKLKNVFSENIVRIVEYGDCEGRAFEVQKYYSTASLESKKLSFEEIALNVVPQLNKALQDIHSINITHNDIKPENIIFADGKYMLTDFSTVEMNNTAYTPEFASPELMQTGFSTTLSDYYSLGVTLYVLLTGFNPFTGLNSEQQLELKASGKWIEHSFLPAELYTLIEGLCHTSMESRWRYDHVNIWCNVVKEKDLSSTQIEYKGQFGSFTHNGRVYSSNEQQDLVLELLVKWDTDFISDSRNKVRLKAYSSLMANAFETCESIEDADQRLVCFVYHLPFNFDKVYWKGAQFDSVETLAVKMLNECFNCYRLKKYINEDSVFSHEVIEKQVISRYVKILGGYSKEKASEIRKLESSYKRNCTFNSEDGILSDALRICYKASGSKELPLPDGSVSSIHQLRNAFVRLLNGNSVRALNEFMDFVCDENGKPSIPVIVWQEQLI